MPVPRRAFRPRVSVVTGAGSGIGAALAAVLAARGSHVVVADLDAEAAREVANRVGGSAAALDVTDAGAARDLVERTVTDHGGLDLMVNNAGVAVGGHLEELTDAHWEAALATNLGGVVNGVRAAVPVMRRQGGGRVLNTASVAGLVPVPGMLPYVTSKYGVVGLSLGLRAEVAGDGIGVSVLCPSAVDTAIFEHVVDPPASLAAGPREIMRRVQPRFLTADGVARRAVRGLERDQAVIAVGLVAQLAWRATRVSPGLATRLAAAGGRAHRRRP